MKNVIFLVIAFVLMVISHQEVFSHEYESVECAVYSCIIEYADRDQGGQISGDNWNEMEILCRSIYEEK